MAERRQFAIDRTFGGARVAALLGILFDREVGDPVEPQLFEIGFEGINRSSRHKSGIALRFPRILRWRHDKPKEEADTLESLKALLGEGTE